MLPYLEPIREFPEILVLSSLLAFGSGSLYVLGISFVVLLLMSFSRALLPWFIAAWSSLWAVVAYQFFEAFFRNLFKLWPWGRTASIGIAAVVFVGLLLRMRWQWKALRRAEAAWRAGQQRESTSEEKVAQEPAPVIFDPYAVLGLEPPSSAEEIRSGYRRAIALYHPDKVQHLGQEFRALAHEKTLQIRRAFDALSSASKL